MIIESASFKNNGVIPQKYTCDGQNTNPPLVFRDVPSGAKSLALVIEDPDVPTSIRADGMFDHLVMWGISPDTRMIEEGAVSGFSRAGVLGKATNGKEGYVGPCPPDREHRYFFKLFALDTEISLPAGSTKAELLRAMEGHILEESELIGAYNRSQKTK